MAWHIEGSYNRLVPQTLTLLVGVRVAHPQPRHRESPQRVMHSSQDSLPATPLLLAGNPLQKGNNVERT